MWHVVSGVKTCQICQIQDWLYTTWIDLVSNLVQFEIIAIIHCATWKFHGSVLSIYRIFIGSLTNDLPILLYFKLHILYRHHI